MASSPSPAGPSPAGRAGVAPLRALARHPLLTLLLVGALTALGVFAGRATPVSHTAETRLAVGAGEMSAFAIPGFPLASRELASNYARWVQNTAADPSLATPGVTEVRASPIPDSNIVRIEAEGSTPQAAKAGATAAAQRLVEEVNTARAEASITSTKAAFDKLAEQAGAAEARVSALQAQLGNRSGAPTQERLAEANAAASKLRLERDAKGELYRRLVSQSSAGSDLKIVQETAATGDDHVALMARYGLLGLGAGLVLSFLAAMALENRRARRRAAPVTADADRT